MTNTPDERADSEYLPANGRTNASFRDRLSARLGASTGRCFILAGVLVILCSLLTSSCSKEEQRDSASPSAESKNGTPQAARLSGERSRADSAAARPGDQPSNANSAAARPEGESLKAASPAELPIQDALATDYRERIALANIGVIGFSGILDVTGDVTNLGSLIVDEVEISIRYLNGAGETVFTDQHQLIGELSSPKPLLPGQTQLFDYRVNSQYYAKAPDLDVEITDLRIRPPAK